ncbi:deiodinase-like protein [Roseibium polysiphoniae]|uniref:deiodinase-like protein n=1 Tax=Roseibium polysiphoniae TaxID=2571221 RepID=UPI003297084F
MMASYNYDEFSTSDYDFDRIDGVALGGKAKDFTLETTDGESRRLLDFSGEFLVLEMGSRTCPLFQSRRNIMQPLEREFSNLSFAVLYVREAHPGSNIPGHKSFEDKATCARQLKEADGETRTVFIDTFEGLAHQAYGSMPNAVFIINKNGCVVFRSDWNNPSSTRKALRELVEGRPITARSFFRPAVPTVAIRTMKNAGKGSAADFFKGLPFLVWTNVFKRNWRLLFKKPAQYSGETLC